MVPEFRDVTVTEMKVLQPFVPAHFECGRTLHLILLAIGYLAIWLTLAVSLLMALLNSKLDIESGERAIGLLFFTALGSLLAGYWLVPWAHRKLFGKHVPAVPLKKETREVTQNKQVAEHRCCVQCRHPVKNLRS